MTYYNTLYYKTLSLELTDCDTCKKRHCKYYLCECDKKILEKNYKYNYQIKKHKRQLRCNKAYSNGKGVYCLNGYADDCNYSVSNYFDIIESKKEKNKKILDDVMAELSYLTFGSESIIQDWKQSQDEPLSAPVYNDEEDRMELKVWCRGNYPFKDFIKECLE